MPWPTSLVPSWPVLLPSWLHREVINRRSKVIDLTFCSTIDVLIICWWCILISIISILTVISLNIQRALSPRLLEVYTTTPKASRVSSLRATRGNSLSLTSRSTSLWGLGSEPIGNVVSILCRATTCGISTFLRIIQTLRLIMGILSWHLTPDTHRLKGEKYLGWMEFLV